MSVQIVSIEGNIGSGKSTLLENLKTYYGENECVIFLREPVHDWETITDKEGNTMLQKFYDNQEKYAFPFQMMAYISRLAILRNAYTYVRRQQQYHGDTRPYTIITERCLHTDKQVFAKMLYEQGKIEDVCYRIYMDWFDEFAQDFPVSHFIYVKTNPENCYHRIHKRARTGEEVIPMEYLQNCHTYHETFLDQETSKLVLDGNVDIYENAHIVDEWTRQIHAQIV
jgi:deoxyadenosine/deoxycytidine kinase